MERTTVFCSKTSRTDVSSHSGQSSTLAGCPKPA
jgi:hypothetical protein